MLFDLVSAPKITRAARFCSLRTLVKLFAEQFDQIVDPYNIIIEYAQFNRDESPYLSKNRYSLG